MGKIDNRILKAILNSSIIHTFGMAVVWTVGIVKETDHPFMTFNWYVVIPVLMFEFALAVSIIFNLLRKRGRVSEAVFEQVTALMYACICCGNFIILHRFDVSFLVLMLPFVLLLLEHRSVRSLYHVIILIGFYEAAQFLPEYLPGEPVVYLNQTANIVFGIYISICIMLLLWETKDAYAYSIRKKQESELRQDTYREFLLKKNREVREAIHNLKGTGELILRQNVSDVSSGYVMEVMDACDKVLEMEDRIIESSRAELFNKNMGSGEHIPEESTPEINDGTYLYAPNANVLVADDSIETLKLTRVLLARTGMRIDTVLTGAEALKMMSYNFYNLIVLDHMFSDMSAIQIIRSMKEGSGVNADTPMIVCTTGDEREVRDMYIAEGFADVVRKPLSGEQIERLTEKHLPARLVSRIRID